MEYTREDSENTTPDETDRAYFSTYLQEVLGILAMLPKEERRALILRIVDGEGLPMIAKTLGVGIGTAYNRVRDGRERLAREAGEDIVKEVG